MTATEHRKDADIRAALALMMEARHLIHGHRAGTALLDLTYNLVSEDFAVEEFPVDVVPA